MLKLSIQKKLVLSYAIVIILTAMVSAIGISSTIQNVQVADHAQEVLEVRHARTRSTYNTLFEMHKDILALRNKNADAASLKKIQEEMDSFNTASKAMHATRYPKEIGTVKEKTDIYINNYQQKFLPLISTGNAQDKEKAFKVIEAEMTPDFIDMAINLETVIEYQIKDVDIAVTDLKDMRPVYVNAVIAVIALIIAIFTAYSLPKYIIKSVSRLTREAEVIAAGDLSTPILTHAQDEMGTAIHAVEHMRSSWKDRITQISEVATQTIENSHSINEITTQISEKSAQAQNRAMTVAAASDEMVSTTADIAKNCENAAKVANESVEITNQGVQDVEYTIDGMHEQVKKTTEDANRIKTLFDQTQKIGTIVQTIEDIASQTNLLALNAAIEAARAGEAGKGFAVVADEVRALASRSSSSTQEITKMVSQIQDDASMANESMTKSLESINDLSEKAANVRTSLHGIISKVNDVNSRITQIATAAEQQTTATSEISENMQQITDATNEFVKLVEKSQSQVVNNVDNVTVLLDQMKKFKI